MQLFLLDFKNIQFWFWLLLAYSIWVAGCRYFGRKCFNIFMRATHSNYNIIWIIGLA